MADTLYVVLGASGHVGGTIAERLLDAKKKVRVSARSADKLKGFAARGAEVVTGSIDDPAFLKRAFQGAGAAFVLLPPNLAPGIRAWQDRTAAAIGDALEAAKVARSVTLSSIGADQPGGAFPRRKARPGQPQSGFEYLDEARRANPVLAGRHSLATQRARPVPLVKVGIEDDSHRQTPWRPVRHGRAG